MLRALDVPPIDLAQRGEVTKHSRAFDVATGDTGDLRIFASKEGKKYLRVWETTAKGGQGAARWYEMLSVPVDPTKTK